MQCRTIVVLKLSFKRYERVDKWFQISDRRYSYILAIFLLKLLILQGIFSDEFWSVWNEAKKCITIGVIVHIRVRTGCEVVNWPNSKRSSMRFENKNFLVPPPLLFFLEFRRLQTEEIKIGRKIIPGSCVGSAFKWTVEWQYGNYLPTRRKWPVRLNLRIAFKIAATVSPSQKQTIIRALGSSRMSESSLSYSASLSLLKMEYSFDMQIFFRSAYWRKTCIPLWP